MKLFDYVKNLTSDLERVDILNDISDYGREYKESIETPMERMVEMLSQHTYKSEEIKNLITTIKMNLTYRVNPNFFFTVQISTKKIPTKLEMLNRMVERDFGDIVITNGLRYDRANVLKYVETIGFVMTYCRKLILRTLKLETEEISGVKDTLETKQLKIYLKENSVAFAIALNVLVGSSAEQLKLVSEIPQQRVTEESEEILGAATDPFRLGFISPSLNPIYIIGRYRAELQVRRYKERNEEIKQIQNRLLDLKLKREGGADARLDQTIEAYEGRLEKIVAKNLEFEEKYIGS